MAYIGLVEVGVGLIPAGAGCKEMLLRFEKKIARQFQKIPPELRWTAELPDGGPFPKVQKAFETIAFATVSTSAKEAKKIGYLDFEDKISLSKERLIADAKNDVLELAKNYTAPKPREDILVPGLGGELALLSAIEGFKAQGKISDHDAVIASKLAHILSAGDKPNITRVSEQHILDLECEAFLSLLGMEKSLERMSHMLMKGKPLRN